MSVQSDKIPQSEMRYSAFNQAYISWSDRIDDITKATVRDDLCRAIDNLWPDGYGDGVRASEFMRNENWPISKIWKECAARKFSDVDGLKAMLMKWVRDPFAYKASLGPNQAYILQERYQVLLDAYSGKRDTLAQGVWSHLIYTGLRIIGEPIDCEPVKRKTAKLSDALDRLRSLPKQNVPKKNVPDAEENGSGIKPEDPLHHFITEADLYLKPQPRLAEKYSRLTHVIDDSLPRRMMSPLESARLFMSHIEQHQMNRQDFATKDNIQMLGDLIERYGDQIGKEALSRLPLGKKTKIVAQAGKSNKFRLSNPKGMTNSEVWQSIRAIIGLIDQAKAAQAKPQPNPNL